MLLGIFSLINFFICLRNTNWSKAFDIQASILSSKFTAEMAAVVLVTTLLLCLLFEKTNGYEGAKYITRLLRVCWLCGCIAFEMISEIS